MNYKILVYIAGPYRGKTIFHVIRNIYRAWRAAYKVWKAGYVAVCPHANTLFMSEFGMGKGIDFIKGDLAILRNCHAILMLPGWRKSKGAMIEHQYALDNSILVIYYNGENP